jgi:caffeoyl-CoA O-methyltransferase
MSLKFEPMSEATHQYWLELLKPEDDLLRSLSREAEAAGIPAIAVAPEQGLFLRWFMAQIGAKKVLEIGTLAGYSAICMARGMTDDSELLTCEFVPLHADFAEKMFARAGLARRVKLLRGAALDHLPGLEGGAFDFIFIDADKPSYGAYLTHALRLLKPGGIVCADNANGFGLIAQPGLDPRDADTPRVEALRQFNARLAAEPSLEPVYLPLGDGMLMGRKKS